MKSTGWKGIAGGICLILGGLAGGFLHFIMPEAGLAIEPMTAFGFVAAGLGVLGIRLKLNA